jgi:hypothetical protein
LYIAQLRAAPLAPYDEGAAERSEAGGEKNVLSSLPQSKIGPKVPIFASSLTEGAKAAFGGKRNDKSQFIYFPFICLASVSIFHYTVFMKKEKDFL